MKIIIIFLLLFCMAGNVLAVDINDLKQKGVNIWENTVWSEITRFLTEFNKMANKDRIIEEFKKESAELARAGSYIKEMIISKKLGK